MKKHCFLLFIFFVVGINFCKAQTYTNLVSMNKAVSPKGQFPFGGTLLNVAGTLYGLAENGGADSDGVMFSYNIGSSTYTDLEDLNDNIAPKGDLPRGSLINVSGILYGMAYAGGAHGGGLIFSYNIGTSTYTDLYDFSGGAGGSCSFGTFIALGNVLYGITYLGGVNNSGNIFSFNIGTNTYTNLYSFASATGKYPLGSLTNNGGILYGMANRGGANGLGCLFSFDTNGSVYTDLVDFNGGTIPMGGNPQYGGLTLYNNILYGMTYGGGTNGDGVIFSYNPVGAAYTDIYNFAGGTGGQYPYGSLLLSGNTFFGMTGFGGANNYGNIFSFDILTSTYTNLYSCAGGVSGAYPYGSLTLLGDTLYGTSVNGGVNDYGNIFSFIPACTLSASATGSVPSCSRSSDGSATATVNGGTGPYTYAWKNAASQVVSTSNPTGPVLSAGTYTVTVTDNTGICTTTATVTIIQPQALSFVRDSEMDNGGCNGSAWVNLNGGTMPYTYAWNPGGNTTDSIYNQCPGSYCCIVTDAKGCKDSVCLYISQAAGIKNIASNAEQISIYPNPSNGFFQLGIRNYQLGMNSQIQVYNMLGEKVYSASLTTYNSPFTIDLSSQSAGVYLYRITTETGDLVSSGKLVIER